MDGGVGLGGEALDALEQDLGGGVFQHLLVLLLEDCLFHVHGGADQRGHVLKKKTRDWGTVWAQAGLILWNLCLGLSSCLGQHQTSFGMIL